MVTYLSMTYRFLLYISVLEGNYINDDHLLIASYEQGNFLSPFCTWCHLTLTKSLWIDTIFSIFQTTPKKKPLAQGHRHLTHERAKCWHQGSVNPKVHAFSSYYIETRIFWYCFDMHTSKNITTQIMLFLNFTSLENLKESTGVYCTSLCPIQHIE